MRSNLNRYIPYYVIVRWWYILAAGPAAGLILSLITNVNPVHPIRKLLFVVEGPPSNIESVAFTVDQGWKDQWLFAVLGFLLACGVIWLLEELRTHQQDNRQP